MQVSHKPSFIYSNSSDSSTKNHAAISKTATHFGERKVKAGVKITALLLASIPLGSALVNLSNYAGGFINPNTKIKLSSVEETTLPKKVQKAETSKGKETSTTEESSEVAGQEQTEVKDTEQKIISVPSGWLLQRIAEGLPSGLLVALSGLGIYQFGVKKGKEEESTQTSTTNSRRTPPSS